MAKSALMTEEEITLALFLYPVGNALFTLISGFVSDNYSRNVLFGVDVLFAVYL